ncbi:MAG: ABC transporter permease [Dehalococcoidia bacterium]
MTTYIVRRLLLTLPTLLVITLLVFSILRLLPGDVVKLMISEQNYAADENALRKQLGLADPAPVQFARWTWNAARGDFGKSLWTKQEIGDELKRRFPVSAELGLYSVLIGVLIALPVGIVSAVRQDSLLDYLFRSFSIGLISVPGFWLATLLLVMPLIWFDWSPPLTFVGCGDHQARAVLFLAGGCPGATMRLTRNQMLEVLRQDYIRTAHSKGLRERSVIARHALKNALIPVVTVIGLQIAGVVSGTVIFESIFSIPGIGRFYYQAIVFRDYPAVQATALFIALTVLLTNIVVDVTYAVIDPRIRFT